MGVFKRIKNVFIPTNQERKEITMDEIIEMFKGTNNLGENLSEITYFTCIKMLSESLGKLSLKYYQDTEEGPVSAKSTQVSKKIKTRPNPYMTPSTFLASVEFNRNQHGNAYVWNRWHKGNLIDQWILQSEYVTLIIDDAGLFGTTNDLYYLYEDPITNIKYKFNHKDIMHFKTGVSRDGITGLSVQEILHSTVEGNKASQSFLNNLHKGGMSARAALEYTGDLNKDAERKLLKGIEEYATGAENAGKFIPLPLGMKIVPLDLKLTDSQFFDLKKYSSLQIAAAFGIKPNHINDYSKSSYSNSEMQNISFYVDTLLFILKQYEEEINYKLQTEKQIDQGYYYKFNVNSILRADLKSQIESLSTGVQNGIYTPNEARAYLDKPKVPEGDKTYANGNIIPLEMAGEQYRKGGDK
ncbi:phage portal protein [Tissierella creatinophila]|uniref:Phage portal protein n=1 Tax=Tissierella creatinophila DSM 6911 TaxID=1123403 RepID=A0A1U7M6Q2_TISCR|nr:phage portal protein [Tissierella creatinophila]OLS02889.1 phage portal protein [Tissierella creatinophila DSM 6911]